MRNKEKNDENLLVVDGSHVLEFCFVEDGRRRVHKHAPAHTLVQLDFRRFGGPGKGAVAGLGVRALWQHNARGIWVETLERERRPKS